jgi:D-amino peptidase
VKQLKIYINTDLEGVSSFVDWEEAQFKTGRGIEYTKRFLTAEVNAAIEGIMQEDGGAEIVVQDGHGGGYWGPNMIAEELNPRATLIQGKRGIEIAGIDPSFDLLMSVGVHSMAGTQKGLMNHTVNHNQIMNFWINGVKVGEIGIWAAIAGYYGVPVCMLSGDFWAIEEARALLGEIEGVAVKKGLNMYTAECLNPLAARKLIKEAARSAVQNRGVYKPYKVEPPIEIKIEYSSTYFADKAELRLGVTRIDGRTVRVEGNDFMVVINQAL